MMSAREIDPRLSASDVARLDSWTLELAAQVRGDGREETSGGWRFGANDALIVHPNGYWHDFSADVSGHGALSLLAHLHGDDQAGVDVARTWLAQNPGDGRLGRDNAADEDDPERSILDAEAEAFIDAIVLQYSKPVTDSPEAKKYFVDRKLDIVATGAALQLKWLSNWRGDEGAIVAPITGNAGELVAIQILHITPDGKKSEIQPVRKILRGPHDWRRRGAFRLGSAASVHLVEVEGVEDAIAAMMAGAERVHAVLGASGIGRAELPSTVTDVTVARDDDPPGSPASLLLGRGVARIKLQGRRVKVTPRAGTLSAGAKDLNDLLKVDVNLARRALSDAGFIKPSLDAAEKEAFLDEVSQAPTDAYETNRVAIATALGWRVTVLDDDRSKRRQSKAKQGGDPVTQNIEGEPWPDPVPDIAFVLDAAVEQFKRFLVADSWHYDAMALWGVHAHAIHNEKLAIDCTPRLAFQSPKHRCGKSTGLKLIHLVSHNAWPAASITPASLFRAVDALKVSLMVDEADNVFKHANHDLIAILNSGIDRMTAYAVRTVPLPDGRFEVRKFSTFTGIAFTSIKQLPIVSAQDRVIALELKRARKSERPQKLTARVRGPLIEIGRQFKRWAFDLTQLPDPDLPDDLYNRTGDKWYTLFQIAKAAGGNWPGRCRKAALAALACEEAGDADGKKSDLLADVWRVFREKSKTEIHTKELCAALNDLEESPWSTAKNGKRIDGHYLHLHLSDFIPGKAEDIAPRKFYVGNVQAHGYSEKHFEDAFDRYLGRKLPSQEPREDTSAKRNSLAGGGSNTPSCPSYPSQGPKSDGQSTSCSETGQNEPPVSPVSTVTGAEADNETGKTGEGLSLVSENGDKNQQVKGNETGKTSETGTLTPSSGEHVSNVHNGSGNTPDDPDGAGDHAPDDLNGAGDGSLTAKPNGAGAASPTNFQFPRGGRGRKIPRKGAPL